MTKPMTKSILAAGTLALAVTITRVEPPPGTMGRTPATTAARAMTAGTTMM